MCLTKKLEWTKQSKQSLNWIRLVQRRPPPSSNMCIRAFVRWTSCGCGWFEWEKWNAQWLRSGFGNRQLVNFSDCVWGFGRLRKKKFLPWKGHLLSLLYAKGCRLHECTECRESAWSNGGGGFFPSCGSRCHRWLLSCVLINAGGPDNEYFWHLVHACSVLEPKTTRGGIELVGGGWWVCTCRGHDLWSFSLKK